MQHPILAACGAIALASALTLSAQTPTPTPAPSTPTRADDKSITVTGCLKTWDATMGAAPAIGAAAAVTERFVLTGVDGATMGEGAAAGATQYIVVADTAVNLKAHLNHRVQLTGTASKASDHAAMDTMRPVPAPPAEPAAPAPHVAMAMTSMEKAWATLTATSLTMVAATCPAQS